MRWVTGSQCSEREKRSEVFPTFDPYKPDELPSSEFFEMAQFQKLAAQTARLLQ